MGLMDAIRDPNWRKDVGQGVLDATNRGLVAGALGAPVDAAANVVNLGIAGAGAAGHGLGLLSNDQLPRPIENAVGGSEWIGKKMQDAGVVSNQRNLGAEFLAGFLQPGGAQGHALQALPALGEAAHSSAVLGPLLAGVMSKEGKAQLLADLKAGISKGIYRLGDISDGQARALEKLGLTVGDARDVVMTPNALAHIHDRRIVKDGYTPDEVAGFAEQAMSRRAVAEIDPASRNANPSLVAPRQRDPSTGTVYDARMPLQDSEAGLKAVTVVPDGLRGRNDKAPKR